jgi:hypothetical protein
VPTAPTCVATAQAGVGIKVTDEIASAAECKRSAPGKIVAIRRGAMSNGVCDARASPIIGDAAEPGRVFP